MPGFKWLNPTTELVILNKVISFTASDLHNHSASLGKYYWGRDGEIDPAFLDIRFQSWIWYLDLTGGFLNNTVNWNFCHLKNISISVEFPIRVTVVNRRKEGIWICPWNKKKVQQLYFKIQPKSNLALASKLNSLLSMCRSHLGIFLKNQERITFLMTPSIIFPNK